MILFFGIILSLSIFVLFHIICLSRLTVTTSHWLPTGIQAIAEERQPRPLLMCGAQDGAVTAETRYAVVSIMSGAFALYGIRSQNAVWKFNRQNDTP
jgi:hypothetical protein